MLASCYIWQLKSNKVGYDSHKSSAGKEVKMLISGHEASDHRSTTTKHSAH